MDAFLDQSGLSVGALNVLKSMGGEWSVERVLTLTCDQLMARRGCGKGKASEIIAFQERCRAGEVQDTGSVVIPRESDPLPPLTVDNLSNWTRNVLIAQGIEMTPHGICALDRELVHGFKNAGNLVVSELMALKARCLNGDVWNDEVHEAVEETLRPERFRSLAEYVLAVAAKVCTLDARSEDILRYGFGLLNVESSETKAPDEMGRMFGGVTRQCVDQKSMKLKQRLFSDHGKALFADFVHCSEAIFARNSYILREGELVAGLNEVYSGWSRTTEFSALRLLERCSVSIEKNDSGYMAWMDGGAVKERYDIYLALLEDGGTPLENLTWESLNRDAGLLGLDGINEDEYRFIVQRIIDRYHHARGTAKARWHLFLRLRCGLHTSDAERRRYVVSRALRAAGMRGLTHAELVPACKAIDPAVDIGEERNLDADASPQLKYDMDGTGARLFVYDFGDRTHDKRFSLDVFFKDDELVRLIKAAGQRLCRHMEKNCLGAANITRLRREIQADLPVAYADGFPSACLYALMREHEAGGLRYYDHPNVAHPGILDADGNPPKQAISWLVYEYFLMAGHEAASWSQLVDFCEVMLGMDGVIASATVLPTVRGEKMVVDGEERYKLKAPDETMDPPNVLLDGGEIDSELSFCVPRSPAGMNFDADGKARDINTYVRAFLFALGKSGYGFSDDEKTELADPGWCEACLGIRKAVFLPAGPGSSRPNTSYFRATYRVGNEEYWVSSYWVEKHKSSFDSWAQALAERAGFAFAPYALSR